MMSNQLIHPTAIIGSEVEIEENVYIGAYSILEGRIKIGSGTRIEAHCVLKGNLTIGRDNKFYQFCSVGEAPQDLSYKGEETFVEIGDRNTIREYVSIHRATLKQNKLTKIGNDNLLMAHVHIGHDCSIGNDCIFVNSMNLAGHVNIADKVTIGGNCGVTQFVSIGKGCYVGGASAVDRDIPSFCTAMGNRAKLKGINIIGLRRNGFSKDHISEVVDFFRSMEASALSPRSFIDHGELMVAYKENEIVSTIVSDIRSSEVGIASFSS